MKYALTIAFAAVAAPALATGFTPSDLGSAAQIAKINPAEIRADIDEATEQLRLSLAYNPVAAAAERTEGERLTLIGALSLWSPEADLRAKWFMAGAIAQPAKGTWSALYNPLARGWLFINWTETPEGWRIYDAALRSVGPVSWTESAQPYRAALAADYASAHVTAGELAGRVAGDEADKWITGLALWLRDPERRAAADAARVLIVKGDTKRVGGGNIDAMPQRARATYWPIAAIGRADGGGTVFFGSAVMPQILICADFGAGAHPGLEKLSLLNFDQAGATK